jgi:Flp pilus assembly protein TadG
MRLFKRRRNFGSEKGQGLIEAAVILPFMFLLLFNAINFAYFFYIAINISSAPRDGVTYAIQGFQTPDQVSLPTTTSISDLVYGNLTNGLTNGANTPVQVCSASKGVAANLALCDNYPNGSTVTYTPDPDPEAPKFVLNRVDVTYTIQPLIAGQPFGIRLLPSFTVHRQVSMRALD